MNIIYPKISKLFKQIKNECLKMNSLNQTSSSNSPTIIINVIETIYNTTMILLDTSQVKQQTHLVALMTFKQELENQKLKPEGGSAHPEAHLAKGFVVIPTNCNLLITDIFSKIQTCVSKVFDTTLVLHDDIIDNIKSNTRVNIDSTDLDNFRKAVEQYKIGLPTTSPNRINKAASAFANSLLNTGSQKTTPSTRRSRPPAAKFRAKKVAQQLASLQQPASAQPPSTPPPQATSTQSTVPSLISSPTSHYASQNQTFSSTASSPPSSPTLNPMVPLASAFPSISNISINIFSGTAAAQKQFPPSSYVTPPTSPQNNVARQLSFTPSPQQLATPQKLSTPPRQHVSPQLPPITPQQPAANTPGQALTPPPKIIRTHHNSPILHTLKSAPETKNPETEEELSCIVIDDFAPATVTPHEPVGELAKLNAVMSPKDKLEIYITVKNYVPNRGFFARIRHLLFRIWNAIKAIFGKSDWQTVRKTVTKTIINHKITDANKAGSLAERFLVQ